MVQRGWKIWEFEEGGRSVIGIWLNAKSYYRKLWIDDGMKMAAYPSA
jgi:hypothetical protein